MPGIIIGALNNSSRLIIKVHAVDMHARLEQVLFERVNVLILGKWYLN